MDLRHYIRRPDRAFWLDLLSPSPEGTQAARQRRERLTRYSLGVANALTLPYVIAALIVDQPGLGPLILINLVAMLCYGAGQWLAALDRPAPARLLLMITMQVQLTLLIWLTGPVLNMVAFTFVAAALARVLFTPEEKRQLWLFTGWPMLLLILGMTVFDSARVDLLQLPEALLVFTRLANALVCVITLVLTLGLFNREVLRSEQELEAARQSSDNLLHAVLPDSIADELRGGRRMIADRHSEVTVLFADIAGFTPWSAGQPPEQVVSMLERIFSRFDERVFDAGAEKIKTIGDAYMVITGAPAPCSDHASVMAKLAMDFLRDLHEIRAETGIDLNLRIGIHSGPVIAGVIGQLRFTYDVWGDTVNTASRMESHGEVGRIHISDDTRQLLKDAFATTPRGPVEIKGKGVMTTWWLDVPPPADPLSPADTSA